MDKTIADKWIAALRSGTYQQTTGRLKSDRGHCCLGVLCELLNYQPKKDEDGNYRYDGEKSVLSEGAQYKAGMRSTLGVYSDVPGARCLTELNDEGKSFEEIATIIEDNWENL
jgi:hypothetical protein